MKIESTQRNNYQMETPLRHFKPDPLTRVRLWHLCSINKILFLVIPSLKSGWPRWSTGSLLMAYSRDYTGLGAGRQSTSLEGYMWEAEAPPPSKLNRGWETTALCREMIPPIRWLAASCFCERQYLPALAEFLTARLTSNLGKKNTIWHLNFEKLPNLDLFSESSPGNHGNYLPRKALQSVNKAHVS